jgi:hypothetical protein
MRLRYAALRRKRRVGTCQKACIGRAGKSGYRTAIGIIEMGMATVKDGNVLAEPKGLSSLSGGGEEGLACVTLSVMSWCWCFASASSLCQW